MVQPQQPSSFEVNTRFGRLGWRVPILPFSIIFTIGRIVGKVNCLDGKRYTKWKDDRHIPGILPLAESVVRGIQDRKAAHLILLSTEAALMDVMEWKDAWQGFSTARSAPATC